MNNAGVNGVVEDTTAVRASEITNSGISRSYEDACFILLTSSIAFMQPEGALSRFNRTLIQNYDLTVQCLETNYFGAKRMVEAFVPLLQLSDSPRIVNVSSTLGQLQVCIFILPTIVSLHVTDIVVAERLIFLYTL